MTRDEVATALGTIRGISSIPTQASLNALLCKSSAIIPVGKKEVENLVGAKSKHLLYDVDREIVFTMKELVHVREPCTMTPGEKRRSEKCAGCSRTRVLPKGGDLCLRCIRVDEEE